MKLSKKENFIAVLISFMLLTTGCGMFSVRDENRKAPIAEVAPEQEYTYYTVDVGDVTVIQHDFIDAYTIEADSLKFGKKSPIITNVYVKPGDFVKDGTLLAEAEHSEETADIERYTSEVLTYQSEIDYYTNLIETENRRILAYEKYSIPYKSEVLSVYQEALEISTANLNDSVLSLNLAKKNLERCYIYAQDDCTVGYVKTAGVRPLFSREIVATTYPEQNLLDIYVSEKGNIYMVGKEYTVSYEYTASITNEYGVVEKLKSEGTFPVSCVKIIKDNNSWSDTLYFWIQFKIEDEEYAKLNERISEDIGIDISTLDENDISRLYIVETLLESAEQVLRVPRSMVVTVQNPNDASNPFYAVYVPNEKGVVELRYVEVGLKGDNYVEITGGLSEGETIVR